MPDPHIPRLTSSPGFTLIEMVIVIALVGILAVVVGLIIQGPLQASVDTGRRAALTDIAETALTRMTRELRLALPNSIRITTAPGVVAIEMLRTLDGGRYRAAPTTGPPPVCTPAAVGDPLEFVCDDPLFDVLGQLPRFALIVAGADCVADPVNADCVVVFNTGPSGSNDAYAGDNVATITALSDNTGFDGSDQVTMNNANLIALLPAFPLASPGQRFHIVDSPLSFVCDTGTGEINRHVDYPIGVAQSTVPGGDVALLINDVTACDFDYDPGTATRSGLATLSLTITEPASGQSVTLIQQAHVNNQP